MTSFQRRFPVSVRERPAVLWTLSVLTALMLGVFPTPASAGLVLQVENTSAQAGGTGSFDVVVYATSGSFNVFGFSVELMVGSGSGITFTGVDVNTTTAPYLFTTQQSFPLSFDTFPTHDFTGSDSEGDPNSPGYVTVSTTMLGLMHVGFAVDAGTPDGAIPVSIVIGDNTQILDPTPDSLPFTPINGVITLGTSAVPEPSSLLMGIIAATGLILIKCKRLLHSDWRPTKAR